MAEHLRGWLGHPPKKDEKIPPPPGDLTPKTCERYRELAEGQIIPHLGAVLLQKLSPKAIEDWHETLGKTGSRKGGPLAARTIGHAHRVLHQALDRAVRTELITRNVCAIIPPPKVNARKIEILDKDQLPVVLQRLKGHAMETVVVFDLANRFAAR